MEEGGEVKGPCSSVFSVFYAFHVLCSLISQALALGLQLAKERQAALAVSSCSEEEAGQVLRVLEKLGCKPILRASDAFFLGCWQS